MNIEISDEFIITNQHLSCFASFASLRLKNNRKGRKESQREIRFIRHSLRFSVSLLCQISKPEEMRQH
jgi:hypothetical protein